MKKFFYTLLVSITSIATGWSTDKLPSLCDEWNIVVPPFTATDPFHTYTQYLESDTIISGKSYVKLRQEDIYKGALREESNATIYYIPSGSTHDYLLYAFNAKEGDVLDNIWTGGNEGDFPNGKSAVVQSVTQTTPRQFVLSSTDEKSENTLFFRWIEGIGMEGGAVGQDFPLGMPIDPSPELLCAYKNGEQIYVSDAGEKYGCDYGKDTLQYINEVTQVIENTAPSQISPAEWDGEWLIDEWQRTEYMPQEGVYTYYHEPYREAKISADESKRILEIMGYSITLGDATQTVINLSRQLVDNIYGTQDYVYGKLVLVEKKLYIHLRIIGTQDFSVDIYGIGRNNKHVDQASTWCMVNDPDEGGKDVTMSGLVYIGATPCGLDSSAGPCVPCITLVFETNGHMYFLNTEDPVINTRLDSILYELESVNCICGQPVILSGSMHYGEFYDYIYARELLIEGKFQSIDYPYPETPDTVALYARMKDSPGSSTVDPVDPNQIVALLTDNRLIVYEYLGESIFYSLNKADYRPNHMPANERNVRADSFSGSVSFHLIESGRYTLELSNPRWDYLITGSFDYQTGEQGTEETPANDVRCTKVLIDGQLYIRQGDKTYTLTGIQVK